MWVWLLSFSRTFPTRGDAKAKANRHALEQPEINFCIHHNIISVRTNSHPIRILLTVFHRLGWNTLKTLQSVNQAAGSTAGQFPTSLGPSAIIPNKTWLSLSGPSELFCPIWMKAQESMVTSKNTRLRSCTTTSCYITFRTASRSRFFEDDIPTRMHLMPKPSF